MLPELGWRVNFKRVHRLWKLHGMQLPKKQRKRRRLPGLSSNTCVRQGSASQSRVELTVGDLKASFPQQDGVRRLEVVYECFVTDDRNWHGRYDIELALRMKAERVVPGYSEFLVIPSSRS